MGIYLTGVCVFGGGGVMHFSGEKHGKEPERDEDYKVYKHTTGKEELTKIKNVREIIG